jgi:hypothetical protein
MRALFILAAVLLSFGSAWAEMGFDEKYERDYNIFNPLNEYRPNNPLNPINKFDPKNPFNPINEYNPTTPFQPLTHSK